MKDGLGVVTFRMEGVVELHQQVSSDAASMVTVSGMDDDVTSVCMLNAQYHWLVAGDRALDELVEEQEQRRESEQESGHEQERESDMAREPEQEPAQSQSPSDRRDSISSTLTIWPSGFDEIPMFETDEFGNQVAVPSIAQPVAAHLAKHGYIHPDEVEMENLNEHQSQRLPGVVDTDGFEVQKVMRPTAPIANPLPHRGSGELVKPNSSFAEPSRSSADF